MSQRKKILACVLPHGVRNRLLSITFIAFTFVSPLNEQIRPKCQQLIRF